MSKALLVNRIVVIATYYRWCFQATGSITSTSSFGL